MVHQEDGSGPDCCKVYKEEISKEFFQCDWLIFHQSPKSLVINIKEACFSLMWSKAVSSNQDLIIGSNILRGYQM